MTSSPEVDVDGVEEGKERESPSDAVDDCFLAFGEELVDNCAEK